MLKALKQLLLRGELDVLAREKHNVLKRGEASLISVPGASPELLKDYREAILRAGCSWKDKAVILTNGTDTILVTEAEVEA